jgi:hypothetical protein
MLFFCFFFGGGGDEGTKAVNSLVFAEYFHRVVWNATRGDDAPDEVIPHWVLNATAVAVVVLVSVIVVGTRSLGPRTMVIVTSIKVCDPRANPAQLATVPLTKLLQSGSSLLPQDSRSGMSNVSVSFLVFISFPCIIPPSFRLS